MSNQVLPRTPLAPGSPGSPPLPQPPHPPIGARVLHPGDVVLGRRGEQLATLLGSCVAIILVDPRRTVGVMSHIVHVGGSGAGAAVDPASRQASTHGEAALLRMAALLRAHAIEPRLCEAYVYGGGNMFPNVYPQRAVGDSNARWALRALAAVGARVLHHDLGGPTYRRLSWTVGTEHPQVVAVPI